MIHVVNRNIPALLVTETMVTQVVACHFTDRP
jgi:hypothetical protein